MLQLLADKDAPSPDSDATPGKIEPLDVELLNVDAAAAHADAWRALAADCLEPNVFFEPGFALAAARHLLKARSPRFLFVWSPGQNSRRKLVAVCPLAPEDRFGRFLPTWIWTHEQAPLGTPILDAAYAEAALAAIFAFCRARLPRVAGLMFAMLPREGPVAQLLTGAAAAEGRGVAVFAAHRRAVLAAGMEPQRYLQLSLGAARRRKLKKARKSLDALGTVALRIIREPEAICAAAEEFFALEAEGWKGRRGTAFLKSPERAGFARDIAACLGREGKYFVASLDLDAKPLAMALMLESGRRAFWWKITYDEEFSAFSPGVLLALEMTRHLLCDPRIALTDSCTDGEQPMIGHIWSQRMAIIDLFVSVEADRPARFEAVAARERLRRSLRRQLKEIILWLRQWRQRSGRR